MRQIILPTSKEADDGRKNQDQRRRHDRNDSGDLYYEVNGEPLAEVRLFDAIRRAHRAKKA